MVCCGFVVCTTPCQIYLLSSYVTQSVDNRNWFYQFTVVLMDANSCINAFIYAAKYREFQQGVRSLIAELTKRLNEQLQRQVEIAVEMDDVDELQRLQSCDVQGRCSTG